MSAFAEHSSDQFDESANDHAALNPDSDGTADWVLFECVVDCSSHLSLKALYHLSNVVVKIESEYDDWNHGQHES
jgi:hypothetical protein